MRQPLHDLFGHIPVYFHDIENWLIAVPRLAPDSPRAARYVKNYDVVGKITRSKERGDFESTIARREQSPFWWHRFHWG